MGKRAQGVTVHKMHMFDMLPKNGMYYSLWKPEADENNKTYKERRILPPNMSTKIMIKFNHKYKQTQTGADEEIKGAKGFFNQAVAQLFEKAKEIVIRAGHSGQDPSYDSSFWHAPKLGTFLETVSDKTASRFAAKMLQAREIALKNRGGYALPTDCETAKAIDIFNQAIQIASVTRNGAQALMSDEKDSEIEVTYFSMATYMNMVEQFDNDTDTDNDEEPTDDGAPAAKRVKLNKPFTTDGEAAPSFALDRVDTPLTIRSRAPEGLGGTNKTNAKELAMPSMNYGEARLDVASTNGNGYPAELSATLDESFPEVKPESYYDALFARHDPADDWELDLDMDD